MSIRDSELLEKLIEAVKAANEACGFDLELKDLDVEKLIKNKGE